MPPHGKILKKGPVPHQLFNFITWMVGFSDEPELQHKVNIPHDQCCKVASICQDLIYAEAKGRKQTHKSLALGMTVRQLTGSRKLIDILYGLNWTHCFVRHCMYT
jgi:hypothetical protein